MGILVGAFALYMVHLVVILVLEANLIHIFSGACFGRGQLDFALTEEFFEVPEADPQQDCLLEVVVHFLLKWNFLDIL